ncbi:hypothetical protein KJ693_09405 [bacterium]|nr:hypothetical protein [bacterium]MBU1615509.1 hypothetical protein [bacterium]
MQAIKQIVRIPEDHEIRISVPSYIPENEMVEMILLVKERPDNFNQKIRELKEAVRDKLFLDDLKESFEDFKAIDLEGWGQEDGV